MRYQGSLMDAQVAVLKQRMSAQGRPGKETWQEGGVVGAIATSVISLDLSASASCASTQRARLP